MLNNNFTLDLGFLNKIYMKTKLLSLIILLGSFFMVAQDSTLVGSVSDSSTDGPLPGVSVIIKGTQTGTTSDLSLIHI